MALRDVVRTYDQAVFNWTLLVLQAANSSWHAYNPTSPGEPLPFALTFASPERPFGRPYSQDQIRGVPTFPSPYMSIERQTLRFDPSRWNFNRWPAVVPSTDNLNFLMSKFPPPFRLPYILDLRCRYQDSEGSPLISSILQSLRPFYFMTHPTVVLTINFGSPWGNKRVHLFADDLIDNSDLETTENERWLRMTVPIAIDGWMFMTADDLTSYPDPFGVITKTPIVRNVSVSISTSVSVSQKLGTGDGTTVTFSTILDSTPIRHGTVSVSIVGWLLQATDDYNGNLIGQGISSGSVDYSTGSLTITFSSAPNSGQVMNVSYQYADSAETVAQTQSALGDSVGY